MEHKVFGDIKCSAAHNTLLLYLYFNKRFGIHKDASN